MVVVAKLLEMLYAGQGFGQAAEDAHALATALRDGGLNQESLRSFEAGRWPRVAHIGATEQVRKYSSCHRRSQFEC
jgi:2-polyprenyl-6-methoxyphenol hydroxylase-like FAD-dependent oxidoreductase